MTHAPEVLPYGSWPSPIDAAAVARGGVRFGYPRVVGDDVWWIESRPTEGGRQLIVSQRHGDLLPQPWNARTRVHEYGGACYLPLPDGFVFSEWADQRLYRVRGSEPPEPITPAPEIAAGLRYAEPILSPDGEQLWCIRERFTGPGPSDLERAIVAVPLDGSAADDPSAVREVVAGSRFYAFPRISPDGRRLAWIAWDHPDMPWDATELRVGTVADGTVTNWTTLLGGPGESVLQPEWLDDQRLVAITDRSGWWNPWRVPIDGEPTPIVLRAEEFAGAIWQLGWTTYAVLDAGHLLVKHAGRLGVLEIASGEITDLDSEFSDVGPAIHVAGSTVAFTAASPTRPSCVVAADLATGTQRVLRESIVPAPDPGHLPTPQQRAFSGVGGREVFAYVYPPSNVECVGPDDECPPYIAFVHGGPTSGSAPVLDLTIAYFTSRGLGVVDVQYGGSTGHGRAYRERLRGQWGVVDVEDSVSVVQALAAAGEADPARLAIRGGSAGGWTTLAALTRSTAFSAGCSYFGVAELVHFVADTHDFESRYVDGLVGPLPQAHDRYIERAPLSHVDDVSCPVLLLQGLEDRIVPPSQAEMFRDALAAKGIPHAYLTYEGEQHGFRKAATIIDSLQAELSFYGQVFGFTPPGVPVLPLS